MSINKEKQIGDEYFQTELQGYKMRENILEEEVVRLRNIISKEKPSKSLSPTSEVKTASPNSSKEEKEDLTQGITDLPSNTPSRAVSTNGGVPISEASSSNSFVVLNKTTGQHLKIHVSLDQELALNSDESHKEMQKNLESIKRSVESSIDFYPGQKDNEPIPRKSESSPFDFIQSKMTNSDPGALKSAFWVQNSNVWNGTGARPKNSNMSKGMMAENDNNEMSKSVIHQATSETEAPPPLVQNTKMMVSIPKDEGTYRINHLPPLNYGQYNSITGISSLYQTEPETITQAKLDTKSTDSDTNLLQFNDLNLGMPYLYQKSVSPIDELLMKTGTDAVLDSESNKSEQKGDDQFPSLFSPTQTSTEPKTLINNQPSSNDDKDLSSQLQNLVLHLKSKLLNTDEINQITQCVEDVAKMESRLKEYEMLYQKKHQAVYEHGAELKKIKKENEELRQALQSLQQGSSGSLEPGWVSVSVHEGEPKTKDEKSLAESMKTVTSLNNKLFKANVEWKESWKLRELQFEAQSREWEDKLNRLTVEKQRLEEDKQQLEDEQKASTQELNDEVKKLKHETLSLEQAALVKESHLTREHTLNNKLKTELQGLHRSKGENGGQSKHLSVKFSELQTENLVLKQQMTMTVEDFRKEQSDNKAKEEQIRKLQEEKKETQRTLGTKLKNASLMLKKRETELLDRDTTIGVLQKQVADLHAQLRTAERRTMVVDEQMSTMPSGSSRDLFYPSASPAYNPTHIQILQKQNDKAQSSANKNEVLHPPATSAEHSAESWVCTVCTFINYVDCIKCGMCDSAKLTDMSLPYYYSPRSSQSGEWPGRTVAD